MPLAATIQMIVCAGLSGLLLWAIICRSDLPKLALVCALVPVSVVASTHAIRWTLGETWALSDATQDALSLMSFCGVVIAAIWAYRS